MIIENFWVFAVAALLLNLTPGNDMLYVAARSTAQGPKAGVWSSLGIMAGGMVHTLAAMIGISAVLAQSAFAFTVIKYLGAAYLVYLGIRSLMNKNKIRTPDKDMKKLSGQSVFWQGMLTNVLNPKVALFFLAFLPQFVSTKSGQPEQQILFLGLWFNTGGTLVNIVVALLFGKIGGWLSRSPRFVQWQGKVTGLVLIPLGIKMALTSKK